MPGDSLPAGELPKLNSPYLSDRDPFSNAADETLKLESADGPAFPDFGVTGDWRGNRTALFERGISFKTNVTQFYQGIATGGLDQGFDYGLKLDYFSILEGEKLLGWKGLYLNLHGETRTGQSINAAEGSLLPANFALYFPQPTGTSTALTNFQLAQYLTDDVVVTFGKINTPDGVNIHPFLGGYGTDRFMNTAFVINPMLGRILPYSTPGASISFLRGMDPVFTFMIVDPMGLPGTSGLANLFSNGVSLFTQARIPVTPFGLPGHQTLDAAYSSGSFTSLSRDDYVISPGSAVNVVQQTGTWAINYGFDQFLVVDPDNPRRGWGLFGNIGLSDGNPNPIRWFLNFGLSGISPLPGRSVDSFGLAYFYLGASSVLKDLLPLRDEQGGELFYDAAITSWFRLTADLQAINPGQVAAQSSLLLGLRAKIIF
ncbi:MAG TPA: carbohydrate porin [Planctomycetaceae bacterium]|nr:carbohydrate porin [Planctomycetaceae bacterium]